MGSGFAWADDWNQVSSSRRNSAASSALSLQLGTGDRTLCVHAPNLGERLNLTYFRNGTYDDGALAALDNLFRDRHANKSAEIDTGLYDQLAALSRMFGGREVNMLSGYRSPETNEEMRRRSSGVAKFSYHVRGQAADVYISDVSIAEVHIAALKLNAGGVGYFPHVNFVHVDSGPLRNWPVEYQEMAKQYRSTGS